MPDETISLGTCAQCGAYHGSWEPCPATCPKRCLNCGLLPVAHYLNSSGVLQCLNRVTKTLIGYNYRVDPAGACSCTRLPIFTRDDLCVRCGGDPSLRSDLLRAEGAAPGDDVDPSRSTPEPSALTPSAPSPATTGEGLDEHLSETQCSLAVMRLATTMDHEDPTAAMADVDQRFAGFRAVVASLLARVAQAEQDAARLDWLERHAQSVDVFDPPSGDAWVWTLRYVLPGDADNDDTRFTTGHTTISAAIDAARATPTTETDR